MMAESQASTYKPSMLVLITVLLAAISVAYANSFLGTFVFDDIPNIVDNSGIRSFEAAIDSDGKTIPIGLYRRDLTRWSFVFNYSISQDNPWSYHLVNLLIHATTSVILFLLIQGTISDHVLSLKSAATPIAFATTLLWSLHPVQTESVTYIVQRLEALASLFYIATLYCAYRSAHSGSRQLVWQACAVAALLAGVFSKEIIVTAPLVVLLYDRTFLSGSFGASLRSRSFMYLGFCVAIGALYWNYHSYRAMAAETLWNSGFGELRPQRNVTSWEYLRSQPGVLLHYLRILVFPIGLCAEYGLPVETRPMVYLSKGALILAILGAGVCLLWKKKPLGFLIVSFLLILAPTSTILPLVLTYEHRVYLGSACVFAIITSLIARWILKQTNNSERVEIDWRVKGAFAGLIVCTLGLAKLTLDRNALYQSETRFWTDVTEKRPQNPRGWLNLAAAAYQEADDIQLADQYAQQACKVAPNFAGAWKALGALRLNQAMFDDANRCFEKALSIVPGNIRILPDYAESLMGAGRFADAIKVYDTIRVHPICEPSKQLDCEVQKSMAYLQLGRPTEALKATQAALKIDDESTNALTARSQAYSALGKPDLAAQSLAKAAEIDPNNMTTLFLYAESLQKSGNLIAATKLYQSVLQQEPNFHPARSGLGLALTRQEQFQAAVETLHPLATLPSNPNLQQNALSLLIHCCQELDLEQRRLQYTKLYESINKQRVPSQPSSAPRGTPGAANE
jgi:tetratricopeptide (TPR) repeat protein